MNKTRKTPMMRHLLLTLPCLAAVTARAGVIVRLDAGGLPLGPLATWENVGTYPGDFTSVGQPSVQTVAGVKAVTLGGNADYLVGPIAPDSIGGQNPNRSVEVWAYNPAVADEETLVGWGHRGGPDGTNFSFNYGSNTAWGAGGQWGGGPDIGWNMPGGSPAAGAWHYMVLTYDGNGQPGAGTTRVYSDGVLRNSEFHGNLNTHLGQAILIGGQNQGAGVPGGFNSGLSIARVRIHDTVLTDAEIAAKYQEELKQLFPLAFLTGSKVKDTSTFCFEVTDQLPGSVTVPSSFTVTAGGVRAGWQVIGGEGILNGSITTPAIPVAAGGSATITLKHRYNFEGDLWDGGVIQMSVNGGDFTTVEAGSFTANGYADGTLIGNHVLNGQQAFNAASPGFSSGTYIDSVATVTGIPAGATVRFRFLGAWDEAVTPDGIDWQIVGVKVAAGAATVLDENFASGNGGFTAESTAAGGTWNFISGDQPVLGALQTTKTGSVTTICAPIAWQGGREYVFTIRGKDTAGNDLVYNTKIQTPVAPLAPARDWPITLPGPLGTANSWGVRTFLNDGVFPADNINLMLDFLVNQSADRTPELSPSNVVDTQEPNLNFYDPSTNGANNGVIPSGRPFPGNALSTEMNGGTQRDDNNVISVAHGTIDITETSDYTFNIRGDDGFMFRIKRAEGGAPPKWLAVNGPSQVDSAQQNILFFPNGTGDTNTRAVVTLTPGKYKLEYATWEGGGGFWYQISAAKGFFLNDGDTANWRPVGYVSQCPDPIPYPSMVGNWTVLSTTPAELTQVDLDGADAAVNRAVAADAVAATSSWGQINFFDPQSGGQGRIPGDVPWPRNTEADDNRYAMRMTGTLRIPEAGNYLIGFQGDDGTKITVGGSHNGFSALTENLTGAGIIGRSADVFVNSGSVGAVGNFDGNTSAVFQQDGALAGSTDKAIAVKAADPAKTRVAYTPALNPVADWTAEIWVNPSESAPGSGIVPAGFTCPYSSGNFGDPRSGWLIYMEGTQGWSFRGYQNLGLGTAFQIDTVGLQPQPNTWYHVVGTWESATGTARLFINGVEVGSQTGVTNYVPTSAPGAVNGRLHIGSRADNAFGWSGRADEAAIYPVALSAAQVLSHYENGTDPARIKPYDVLVQEKNPLGYWRLNEAAGKPRTDTGTIFTDVPTGDSSTVGRIFLNAGDYPLSATFWEDGGGSYIEVFATKDAGGGCAPLKILRNGGHPAVQDVSGIALVTTPPAPGPVGGTATATIPPRVNADGTLSLTFPSLATVVYDVQETTDLKSWATVQTVEATGTSTTVNGTVGGSLFVNPSAPRKFYRVVARQ